MSTNRYCTTCGTKHVVGLTPIKFCSNCGTALDGVVTAAQTATPVAQPKMTKIVSPIQSIDQPADETFELPQISASDFIIEGTKPKKLTIGELKNAPDVGAERGTAASPMLTPEQARQNFEKLFVKEREQNTQEN